MPRFAVFFALCITAGLWLSPAEGARRGGRTQGSPTTEVFVLANTQEVATRRATDKDWREIELGQALGQKDRIRTGNAGLATLSAANTRLVLDHATQVLILGTLGKKAKGIALLEGALLVEGPTDAQIPFRVQVTEAELRIRGSVKIDMTQGAVRLAVLAGKVEVAGKKGVAMIPAGSGALLRRGQQTSVVALSDAPKFSTPGRVLFLSQPAQAPKGFDAQIPVVIPEGITKVQVELARDKALTDRLSTSLVTLLQDRTKIPLRLPSSRGRYFARLSFVGTDDLPGSAVVHELYVAEVRGVATASPLQKIESVTDLKLEVLPASGNGKLNVSVDGAAPIPPTQSETASIPLQIGRGRHTIRVSPQGAAQDQPQDSTISGELEVNVLRPTFDVQIAQKAPATSPQSPQNPQPLKTPRIYKVQIRALDPAGRSVPGAESLEVRAGSQPLTLTPQETGVYTTEVVVKSAPLLFSLADSEGTIISAELKQ